MMRTLIALAASTALCACTANPAAHIFLREQAAARSVDNDDRRETTSAKIERASPRKAEEPETVVERKPGPEPTERAEAPKRVVEDVPSEKPTPPEPDETPSAPDPAEAPEPEPEEIEPEPVEDKPNPHPACRRATPAAFC